MAISVSIFQFCPNLALAKRKNLKMNNSVIIFYWVTFTSSCWKLGLYQEGTTTVCNKLKTPTKPSFLAAPKWFNRLNPVYPVQLWSFYGQGECGKIATQTIFSHCSLIFYFLDFKFSNFVYPSELHPLIWFFFKNSFRKKKNIRKTTPNALAPSIFIVLSIVLKLCTPLLHTQSAKYVVTEFFISL